MFVNTLPLPCGSVPMDAIVSAGVADDSNTSLRDEWELNMDIDSGMIHFNYVLSICNYTYIQSNNGR